VIRDKKTVARLLNALDRLDLAAADSAAEEFADDPGANEFWFLNVYAQAQHSLHTGAYADALENIDRSRLAYRDWLTEAATADPLLRATEADLLMAMGRGHQARSVLEDARVDHPLLRVSQARLALFSGQPATALELGRDSGWMRRATARHRLEMLVIKAIAADRLGDRGSALHALRRALGEARALDARRPFVMVRRTDLAALAGCEARLAELLDEPAVRRHPDLFPVELVLTEREARVLEKLAEGLTLQQVADALVVSYNTVKTQQRSLFRRLGAPTRADAIARARQWGLL
jgi:LuxR family maltose regulon positive regulatory protein